MIEIRPELKKAYEAFRKKYPTASIRSFEKEKKSCPLNFQEEFNKPVARWEKDGIVFEAHIVPDTESTPKYLGDFCDKGTFPEVLQRRGHFSRGEYTHFKPAISIKENQEGLVRHGMARGPAYELAVQYAYQDMYRAERFGMGWSYVGIIVRAFRGATLLDEHSVWAYETDSGDDYLASCALEIASELKTE